jgi:peptidoglycan/xylan/chitin deacetylase (PgdA/CDA1 family)
MHASALLGLLLLSAAASAAGAAECPGNPDALGTSRVLVIDPAEHNRLGTMQYRETLPLDDHEVVLTFDDGPLPPYTNRVLETLAAECVKATYFLIGRNARAYPEMVRQIHAAGHTIGSHSQNHPLSFQRMPVAKAQQEIDDGIASITAALGDPAELAPFFRIPGLLRADGVEKYLASRQLMTWSADFPADDWRHISAAEVMKRALTRLEAKGRGVLLLHDMQPATVMMLPALLHELKRRNYRIVQVVPATATLAKTETTPDQWVMSGSHEHMPAQDAPRFTPDPDAAAVLPALPAPSPSTSGIAQPSGPKVPLPRPALRPRSAPAHAQIPLPPPARWPDNIGPPSGVIGSGLPAQGSNNSGHDMKPPAGPEKRVMARARPPVPKTPAARTLRASDVGAGAQWPRLQ